MFHRYQVLVGVLVLTLLACAGSVFAQGSGTVKGTVKDGQTGEPLPSANVSVVGTSLGAVTDVEGRYILRGVPVGTRTLRASYLGYKPKDVQVQVKANAEVTQEFKMAYEGITGEGVTVTVQAEGQMQAINKQLSSMPVMNAVSAARIQELPDANAAESVSRLPGVSLVRTGGEGSKVVIRGLSPQFNQITVDGVELPSDVGSSNTISDAGAGNMGTLGDRAAELSMISSSMLGGIEVIKAITPDMDATLIGGVVNFGLRKAAKGTTSMFADEASWLPLIELRASGGYNDLKKTYNDYKFVGSLEKRFFDQAFGVFVQVSSERRNLSNNALGASYSLTQKNLGDIPFPDLTSLSLTDTWRKRERLGATLVLDYQHETGEIGFMNFVNAGDTRETNRGMRINQGGRGSILYSTSDNHNETNVMSNLLSLKQEIALFHVDLKLSHSYSESRNPEDLYFDFYQDGAGLDNLDLAKVHPKVLFQFAKPNISIARLNNLSTSGSFQKERALTGSLDLQTEMPITDEIGLKVKFGGALQRRTRDFDFNSGSGNQYYSGGGAILTAFGQVMPSLAAATGGVGAMSNWARGDYEYGEFLSGEYSLPYKMDPDLMWQLMPVAKRTSSLEGYQVNKLATVINDYGGTETKSAGYLMTTVNLGEAISILPGVRYQNLSTEYTAMRGRTIPGRHPGRRHHRGDLARLLAPDGARTVPSVRVAAAALRIHEYAELPGLQHDHPALLRGLDLDQLQQLAHQAGAVRELRPCGVDLLQRDRIALGERLQEADRGPDLLLADLHQRPFQVPRSPADHGEPAVRSQHLHQQPGPDRHLGPRDRMADALLVPPRAVQRDRVQHQLHAHLLRGQLSPEREARVL
ncbi:MAG: carboxypeptidase-like regulatory domain-containing protein [Ignavibacteriae bacterium]|nr:carboxypeptidase-like regulatory domain-containing protein [Ignavibacteriota bacterium]